MVIDISNNLLGSIQKELLSSLSSAEAKVADLLDFGEEQALQEVLSLLHLSRGALLMLSEKEAARLCQRIHSTIEILLEDDSAVDTSNLASAFLVLIQYVHNFSTKKESSVTDLEKAIALLADAGNSYMLDSSAQSIITDAVTAIKDTLLGDYPDPYWKRLYKITDVVKEHVQTKESYHYIWLNQQLALFSVKKQLVLPHVEAREYTEQLCDYLVKVLEFGERLDIYQNIHDDAESIQSVLDSIGEVQKNDYQPPNTCLIIDNNEANIIFPISQETIESIAFLIKKELATTKNLFEESLASNSLEEQAVQQALFDSLSLTEAAFRLLGFRPGLSLVEQAEDLLTDNDFEDRYDYFANNIVLIEDALWQLDYLQNEEFMGAQEAAIKQQEHSRLIAVQATKMALAKRAYTFFKKNRDFLIEHFDEFSHLDTLEVADNLHQFVAAYQLLNEQAILPSLKQVETLHLYLHNDKAKLSEEGMNNAYLDLLIAYEILFEQLQSSAQIDKRTLSLLEKSFKKTADIVSFTGDYEPSHSYDYSVDGGYQERGALQHQVLEEIDAVGSPIDSESEELTPLSNTSNTSVEEHHVANEQSKNDSIGGVDNINLENDIFDAIAADKSFLAEHQVAPFKLDDVDEEILEVFIEEGQEISSLLLLETPALKENYFNEEVIANLRRAYHTLKGSGRMVGLNAFGEFAWQHEELFNKAIAGEYQLNDTAFKQLSHAAELVDKTVNSEPFEEPQTVLMDCAAKAYTIRQMLLGKTDFPSSMAPAQIATTGTGTSSVDLSPVNEAVPAPMSYTEAEAQEKRDESAGHEVALPLSSASQVIPDLAAHPALSPDKASQSTLDMSQDAPVNEVFDTKDLVETEEVKNLNEPLSSLKEFIQSAAPTVSASQDNFVEWESEQYQLDHSFEALKTNVDNLNTASQLVDYDDNAKVTHSLSETLANIADKNYPVTQTEADPIKFAIDDLARMHQEILDDKPGQATPDILGQLSAVNQSVKAVSATASIGNPNLSESSTSLTQLSTERVGALGDECLELTLDETQGAQEKILAAGSAGLSEHSLSDDSILPALSTQTNKIRQKFSPEYLASNHFQHDDIIDDIYDLEASLDTQEAPSWVWETLANLENSVNGMQKQGLSPTAEDYEKICTALEAIEQADKIDSSVAKEINNTLMGIRAGLPLRANEAAKSQSPEMATESDVNDFTGGVADFAQKPDSQRVLSNGVVASSADAEASSKGLRLSLQQADDGLLQDLLLKIQEANHVFISWGQTGYSDERQLEQLITAVDDLVSISIENQYDAVSQIAEPLLVVLKRLYDNVEIPLDDTVIHIRQSLDALAVADSSELTAEINASEELVKSAENVKQISNNDKLGHPMTLESDLALGVPQNYDNCVGNTPIPENEATEMDRGLTAANRPTIGSQVTSMHQQFAEEAGDHIEASKGLFDDWKNSDFEHYEPLGRLHDRISDITEISRKHQFDSATELGESVGDVLQRLTEESVKPYHETSEKVSDAINEFDRSAVSARSGQGNPEIASGVIQMVKAVAGSTAVGEVPIPASAMHSVSVGALSQSMVPALPDEIASSQAQSSSNARDVRTGSYKQFAASATGHISASKEHFGDWKATDFTENSPRDKLSENIKDITQLSKEHQFNSGAQLGNSVNEVLERLSEERLQPNPETAQRIEEAVNEFDRSAKAITADADGQEASVDVIRSIIKVSQSEAKALGKPLDSSLMAHELFSESEHDDEAFEFQTAISEDENTVISHTSDGVVEDTLQMEPLTAAPLAKSNQDYGLRSNDPRYLDTTILEIFLDEAHDIIEKNYESLSDWNKDYNDLSAIQEIQRGLHTLKGGARMSELTVLGDLSHYMETLLSAVVDGNISHKSKAHDLLLEGIDLSSEMVRLADSNQVVYESPGYVDSLNQFIEEQTGKSLGYQRIKADSTASSVIKEPPQPQKQQSYTLRVGSELMDKLANLVGEDSIARARLERTTTDHGFQLDELSRTIIRVGEQLRRLENETEAQILFRHDTFEDVDDDFDPLELDRFSEIQQLSRLLAESMEDLQSLRTSLVGFIDESKQIITDQGSIQRELQDKILSASLVRFDSLRPRVETLVRQVAKELNKEISVRIYGGDIEIERKMMEEVIPGLEHVIRNAIAHGIESPEERAALGKSPIGRIRLGVRREGAELWFIVADDGRGANLDAIRTKARSLGMLNEDLADDKNHLLQLLFAPGFSTAQKATQISGRGIGLDVLKEVTNEHNGSIEVETEMNKGMAISVRIPFTMSITDALSVKIGQYHYAIPIMSIEGIARIPKELYRAFMSGEQTHYSYGQYDYRLESLISFIDPQAEKTQSLYGVPALLVRVGRQRIAFEVEEINNRQEIIIKSVNRQFTTLPGVVGAAVLDNGLPVPVVEIAALGREFLNFKEMGGNVRDLLDTTQEPELRQEKPRVLVVDDSVTMRKVSSKILTKYDFEVATAKDGLDAIDVVTSWAPDLILLDIEMPRMDGFEFAIHIRNSDDLKSVPIIMITSRTGEKHRERAKSIGVNGYLGKPYTEEVLISTIEDVLDMEFDK